MANSEGLELFSELVVGSKRVLVRGSIGGPQHRNEVDDEHHCDHEDHWAKLPQAVQSISVLGVLLLMSLGLSVPSWSATEEHVLEKLLRVHKLSMVEVPMVASSEPCVTPTTAGVLLFMGVAGDASKLVIESSL